MNTCRRIALRHAAIAALLLLNSASPLSAQQPDLSPVDSTWTTRAFAHIRATQNESCPSSSDAQSRAVSVSSNFSYESEQAAAQLGFSVASAGDVNGDGYDDVVIGAPYFDNGQSDEGRAFLFLGSPTGLSATPSWTAESNQADARFGYSVASAGDVNGDGYCDVIIGADAFTNSAMHEGRAFVYHGGPTGLSAAPNWFAESFQESALFGASVACAGDVNADGYSDVIIGAAFFDFGPVNAGRAFIWFGSPTGLGANGAPFNADWAASSDQATALFGSCVAGAGDVNGDGYSDVIIAARLYDNGNTDEGRAFVFLGGPTGPALTPAWTAEGDQDDAAFGYSVAAAGDVDGDGYADVIVGAPNFDNGESNEGRAYLFRGGPAGPAPTPAWTTESNQTGASCGYSVAPAGDVNGDGYGDVIVGTNLFSNDQSLEGRAQVFQGGPDGLANAAAWTAEGDTDAALFGESVAAAGDVNGDGLTDIIVGAKYFTNGQTQEGRASVFHGQVAAPSTTPGWTVEGEQDAADMGMSVASAGDVNGDGYADVIVGSELWDNGQTNEGRALLFFGGPAGISPMPNWAVESNSPGAEFGVSVASAGDVNGDGYDDLIIGAWQYSNGQAHEGAVFVYHGGPTGPSLAPDWQYESNQADSWMGRSAQSAGDVNGDGYADVIVGNSLYDNGETDEGRALVFYGSPTGLSTSPDWSAESNQAGAYFGRAVASAGDINGDGYTDVIIGAYLYDNGQLDEGAAFVWYGSASGLGPNGTPANADWMAEGDQANAVFAARAQTAGDVNGDGFSDIIISARNYSDPEVQEGAALVWYGSATGLGPNGTPANADWTFQANQVGALLGSAAASAGDVNGDGFADVIVGAWYYDNGQPDEGAAFIFAGSPTGLSLTPIWTGESNQAGANYGWSAASAGDVNGDGFSDVIVGALAFDNGQLDEGAAFLYYGNDATGRAFRPRQLRVNADLPITERALSDLQDRFRIDAIARSASGRARAKLQWEIKPNGTPFNGAGLQTSSAWTDGGLSGATLTELVSGLTQGNLYHWRARLLFDPARSPWLARSKWLSPGFNGPQEADVRMPVPPPTVTMHPTPRVACALSGPVSFTVAAVGANPLSYQWRKAMMPLSDAGRISGALTATLTIAAPLDPTDTADYDCVVTNFVGMAASNPAGLTVWPAGSGDVNVDGQANTNDIGPFVAAIIGGTASQGNCAADCNADGKLNGSDVAAFTHLIVP